MTIRGTDLPAVTDPRVPGTRTVAAAIVEHRPDGAGTDGKPYTGQTARLNQ